MSFESTTNCYQRRTIIIDTFDNRTEQLVKNERLYVRPPCGSGGCRACDYEQKACEYDPKTGLCGGRMP